MRREIITSNGKLISEGFDGLERKGVVRRLEGSKTQKNWNKLLQRTGLYVPNADAEESELFDLIPDDDYSDNAKVLIDDISSDDVDKFMKEL